MSDASTQKVSYATTQHVAYDAKWDSLVLLEHYTGPAYGDYSFISYDGSTWRVVLASEQSNLVPLGPLEGASSGKPAGQKTRPS